MIDPVLPDFLNTPVQPTRPRYSYYTRNSSIPPVVTIVTPFYNPGSIFKETIACILQQSCQNFEWIIVDDGSDDPFSLKLLAELEQQDARIKVMLQSNQGPAVARNRAVAAAKAAYIFQIDADDLVELTFVEKCLWFLESHPEYGFCNTWSISFGEHDYIWPVGFELGEKFLHDNYVPPFAVIRRDVHLKAGGYDETIRYGHEDWDYWLNLAAHGYWGRTIPEYLGWYRRRPGTRISETQADAHKEQAFRAFLRQKYETRLSHQFPQVQQPYPVPYATIPMAQPFQNPIDKPPGTTRLLALFPWLTMGGADKFNLDLVEQLSRRNYEITICATLPGDNLWLAEFARFTPDIFNVANFLSPPDIPRFLLYLIHSRQIDTVLISNSYLGYQLLPFLRANCPQVTFIDYNHIEEADWKNGGYPRAAVGYQELLDLNVVSTCHLKEWMITQGGDPERIEVCYTNIDPDKWRPTAACRAKVRSEFKVSDEMPLLLYAGRMVEQKRPRLFAEVMRRLAQEEALSFTCLVAGTGEDLPFLQEFVQQQQLDPYIHFLGLVSLERMKDLHAAADIFFLPSKMEGLSLALFEAMTMETVPVVAAVGGQGELVTPECGFLIPADEHELAAYVAALKTLILSPEKRQALAVAGRARILNHFTLDRMVERVVELLNKAQHLARTHPRPGVGAGLGLECATLSVEYTRLEQLTNRLYRQTQDLEARPTGQVFLDRLSGEEIAQRISIKKIIKAVGFKITKQPGLRWLYHYRNLGKKLLGN